MGSLTYVRQDLDATLHRCLLGRHQPVAVVNPEDALQKLDKYRLPGLRRREDMEDEGDEWEGGDRHSGKGSEGDGIKREVQIKLQTVTGAL